MLHAISSPPRPEQVARIDVPGEPTSVADHRGRDARARRGEDLEPIVVDAAGNHTDDEDPGLPGDVSGAGLVQVVALEAAGPRVIDVPLALSGDLLFPTIPAGARQHPWHDRRGEPAGEQRRGSFLAVYDISSPRSPRFVQLLPTGVEPEGILPIPARNLVVAAEGTGNLTILRGRPRAPSGTPERPQISSGGAGEPWAALSGLAADPSNAKVLWSVPTTPSPRSSTASRSGAGRRGSRARRSADGAQARLDPRGHTVDRSIAAHNAGLARAWAARSGFWLASEANAASGEDDDTPNLLVQVGPKGDAGAVKRVYEFTLDGVAPADGTPLAAGADPAGVVVEKMLLRDVLDETAPFEKVEGLAITKRRALWSVVDNDGGVHESRLSDLGVVPASRR